MPKRQNSTKSTHGYCNVRVKQYDFVNVVAKVSAKENMSTSSLPAHGNAIYPWKKWSDGRAHLVESGADFQGEATKFRRMLLVTARRMGRKAKTRVKGNTVWFQFAPKAESPAPKKSKKK